MKRTNRLHFTIQEVIFTLMMNYPIRWLNKPWVQGRLRKERANWAQERNRRKVYSEHVRGGPDDRLLFGVARSKSLARSRMHRKPLNRKFMAKRTFEMKRCRWSKP